MNVGIVGLGLIGGSFARIIKANGHKVLAYDINESAYLEAKLMEAVDDRLTDENISESDIILVCVYPKAAAEFIKSKSRLFKKSSFVIDAAGVKANICGEIVPLAKEYGYKFMGGHPMAGTQFSGFGHSRATLYKDASMILVNSCGLDIKELEFIKSFFISLGFGDVTFTSAEEHDRIIAYTSQLAHVVSNAYVKSPAAKVHKGFSAGSYKDLTRVARLNEHMWCELFLENRENLVSEIDTLIENLQKYRKAIDENDAEELTALLREGRECKEKAEKSRQLDK